MRYERVGWLMVVMTFMGVFAGLAVMTPIEQEECIPRGYGRHPIEEPVRPLNGLLEGDRAERWI